MKKNNYGCPCGHDCCDKPEIVGYEHDECDEEFCEACYGLTCLNCNATCFCGV